MRRFMVHAVMPRDGDSRWHRVRSHFVLAGDWLEARQQVAEREPGALFVTVPNEAPGALMADEWVISPREYDDLRAACDWNEARLLGRTHR